MNRFASLAAIFLTAFCSFSAAAGADDAPPAAKKLHGGFKFVEGPADDGKGNLFFSDVQDSRVYRVDAAGKLSVFRNESNNMNGTMFDAAGRLVGCEMGGRIVAMNEKGEVVQVLADQFEGNRFNAPNDLVIDSAGGIYFTDPHFRAPMPLPQTVTGVYYIAAGGTVTRVIADVKAPNGVILSPDEKTLYVIPSLQAEMLAYPVEAPGKLGAGRIFCTLQQAEGQTGRGGDGLTVDVDGNLYITSAVGIQIFSPAGKQIGLLQIPEQPANCTFGGPDRKTLYVTARTSLYALQLNAVGHAFSRKKP